MKINECFTSTLFLEHSSIFTRNGSAYEATFNNTEIIIEPCTLCQVFGETWTLSRVTQIYILDITIYWLGNDLDKNFKRQ